MAESQTTSGARTPATDYSKSSRTKELNLPSKVEKSPERGIAVHPPRSIRAPYHSTSNSRYKYLAKYTYTDTSDTEGGPGTWSWNESPTETKEEGDGDADGRLDRWRSRGITGLTPASCSLLQLGFQGPWTMCFLVLY